MDCDFTPPVIQPCVAPKTIDVSTPDAAIGWPLLHPPCIPAFSGAVSVSSSGRVGDSLDIGLRPDPSSECGYRFSGAVDLPCVVDADAYVESGLLKWYNIDGLKTTINDSVVGISNSTGIAYDPAINYQFRFWYCHGTGGAADKSASIPSGGAGNPGACVINAQAWVQEIGGRKVIRWQNVDGDTTILNENVAPWADVAISDTTGAHDVDWEYDPAIDYVFKFWKCNTYTAGDFTNQDIIVSIPAVAATPPFALRKVNDTTIRVFAGSVTHPDGTITPAGFNLGDNPPFTVTISGSGAVWIVATIDNATGVLTAVSNPTSGSSMPSNTSTNTSAIFHLPLGTFSTTSGVLTVQSYDIGAQFFELCGGVYPLWNKV